MPIFITVQILMLFSVKVSDNSNSVSEHWLNPYPALTPVQKTKYMC